MKIILKNMKNSLTGFSFENISIVPSYGRKRNVIFTNFNKKRLIQNENYYNGSTINIKLWGNNIK